MPSMLAAGSLSVTANGDVTGINRPGLLLGSYAQWRIKADVAKYSQLGTKDGITGAEVARRLLDSRGLLSRPLRGC